MAINVTGNSSKPIEICNGTVLLDRQRRFSFEGEENSVILISLQYDSGKYMYCIIYSGVAFSQASEISNFSLSQL